MKSKKEDSRIIRTKRDLADSLEVLLENKDFESITIDQICDKALVSKQTFYNYFKNKGELLIYVFSRFTSDLFLSFKKYLNVEKSPNIIFTKSLQVIVNYLYLHQKKLKNIINNDKQHTIYFSLNEFISKATYQLFEAYKDTLNIDIPVSFISVFYSGAFTGVLYNIFTKDIVMKKEQLIKYTLELMSHK